MDKAASRIRLPGFSSPTVLIWSIFDNKLLSLHEMQRNEIVIINMINLYMCKFYMFEKQFAKINKKWLFTI